MSAADMTEEKMKAANMPVILGISIFLSLLLAVSVTFSTIQQAGLAPLF